MSYELGLGDVSSLKRVFCTSIVIHNVIALVIFLFAESLGLWFVNTYLNIPILRMYAVNWSGEHGLPICRKQILYVESSRY